MQIRRFAAPVLIVVCAVSAGCSRTAIDGEGLRHEQLIQGTVGIKGEDNEIRVLAGSDVPKLSIMGEDNRVFVEDGASVGKVEMVGEGNHVSCPDGMVVEFSSIGENNRLTYRH
ncbi:MAG: hypothetical protein JXB13_19310 [Phycisphaerae bacterium]|nr:hypothetical protein [Phycisphaerae bacterium]